MCYSGLTRFQDPEVPLVLWSTRSGPVEWGGRYEPDSHPRSEVGSFRKEGGLFSLSTFFFRGRDG